MAIVLWTPRARIILLAVTAQTAPEPPKTGHGLRSVGENRTLSSALWIDCAAKAGELISENQRTVEESADCGRFSRDGSQSALLTRSGTVGRYVIQTNGIIRPIKCPRNRMAFSVRGHAAVLANLPDGRAVGDS